MEKHARASGDWAGCGEEEGGLGGGVGWWGGMLRELLAMRGIRAARLRRGAVKEVPLLVVGGREEGAVVVTRIRLYLMSS